MKNLKEKLKENRLFMKIHDLIIRPIASHLGLDYHDCYKKINGDDLDSLRDEICASMDEIIKQAKKTNKVIIKFVERNHFQIEVMKGGRYGNRRTQRE